MFVNYQFRAFLHLLIYYYPKQSLAEASHLAVLDHLVSLVQVYLNQKS